MRNSLERLKASYQAAILHVVPLTTAQAVAEDVAPVMIVPAKVQMATASAEVRITALEVAENAVLAMTVPARVQTATENAEVRTTAPVVEASVAQVMIAQVHNSQDYAESISFSLYSNNTKRSKIRLYQSEYSSLGGY